MHPTRPTAPRHARARHPDSVSGRPARRYLAIALALACLPGAALAAAPAEPADAVDVANTASTASNAEPAIAATDLDAVLVVAQRASRVSNGALNLDLPIKDTPQSISVVGSEQMRQFGAGTINYVRKRPTNEREGTAGLGYGSWSTLRAELDYSTPFTADGTWAGRIVAAHEDGGARLRANANERSYVYGVVDGQVGDSGTLAFGYSCQRADSDGIMWGALV